MDRCSSHMSWRRGIDARAFDARGFDTCGFDAKARVRPALRAGEACETYTSPRWPKPRPKPQAE
ncbi:hypothetical protein [Nocardia sp. NPDC005366]|uniref:hypothetical protein n=1 Tax=Nocardia sp. NPDC005366 TaxID=3156878 RepID=UPI0033AE05A6